MKLTNYLFITHYLYVYIHLPQKDISFFAISEFSDAFVN